MIDLKTNFKQPINPGTLVFVEGGVEIEEMYLIGDFDVIGDGYDFRLTNKKANVKNGNLVHQGYPFFAGEIVLSQKIKLDTVPYGTARLMIEGLNSCVSIVKVNGKECGKIFWHPHEVDVSGKLKQGENDIEITLCHTLRNLLGPIITRAESFSGVAPDRLRF